MGRLFERYQTSNPERLALELCPGGHFAWMLAEDAPLPIDIVRLFARDLASGLNSLHQYEIVHRELCPGNVLMNESWS
jgi:serine/threonine protein kinase